MKRRSFAADLTLGLVAGVAATFVMDRVTTVMYEREDRVAREREDRARDYEMAYHVAAKKLARLAHRRLSPSEKETYGQAIHWAIGISAGVIYGALRNRIHGVQNGFGVPYGLAFALVMDEIMVPALGLTPGPRAFPWQTHARSFVGHAVMGAGIEAVFRSADAV